MRRVMDLASMKKHLDGMYWTHESVDLAIPFFGNPERCVAVFNQNLAAITWNCMSTLEDNPATLPQTETILEGQTVGGLSFHELLQIKNYGDAAKVLGDLIRKNQFALDKKTACFLHKYTGKEDALTWGEFRSGFVAVQGIKREPPCYEQLDSLANEGFAFLNQEISNPKERAIAVFLFMARSQFFYDANKRNASLMMNGVLMSHGYLPITFLNRNSEVFHAKLKEFYETGNADPLFSFFSDLVRGIYSVPNLPKDMLQSDPWP